MHYSQQPRKPFIKFSSRSLGSSLELNNNPVPTIKQGTDNSNAHLVVALVGLALLFCIYLYFLFRPILKDKNCVAPYDSSRNRKTTVIEDLEKGMPRRSEIDGEKRPEADVATHLEKRKLRQWLHRASRGRFFSDPKDKKSTQDNRGKAKNRTRYERNRFRMPTICVSPPPPVYGSDGIKADPICCLSDSHNHKPQESSGEKALVQRPTDALLVPTKTARPEPKHHSLIQSSVPGDIKNINVTRTVHPRDPLDNRGSGRTRTILSRSFTM